MPITSVDKDLNALTMTVVADFAAPVRRLWDAYVDPRQIERFWGPPTWPATFIRHDAAVGGRSVYTMHGPDGEASTGYWEWVAVDAPHSFEVRDGFAHEDGLPNTDLPNMRMVFDFEPTAEGSRLVTTTYFNSAAELQQLLEMGTEEGMRQAMGQIDDVLADLAAFSASIPTDTQILGDTEVRISRVIRGSAEDIWRAHSEAELLQRWLLGPDGWVMPVCDVATSIGDTYRYEWARPDGSDRFGFIGELLEADHPYRMVTTEAMIGMDGPPARNEMTLTPMEVGTLMSLVITYPSKEVRDMVLATGMTDGMETSYARLEAILA